SGGYDDTAHPRTRPAAGAALGQPAAAGRHRLPPYRPIPAGRGRGNSRGPMRPRPVARKRRRQGRRPAHHRRPSRRRLEHAPALVWRRLRRMARTAVFDLLAMRRFAARRLPRLTFGHGTRSAMSGRPRTRRRVLRSSSVRPQPDRLALVQSTRLFLGIGFFIRLIRAFIHARTAIPGAFVDQARGRSRAAGTGGSQCRHTQRRTAAEIHSKRHGYLVDVEAQPLWVMTGLLATRPRAASPGSTVDHSPPPRTEKPE